MTYKNSGRFGAIAGWMAFLLGFFLPISTAADNIAFGAIFVVWLISADWAGKYSRLRQNPAALAVAALLLFSALGLAWGPGSLKEGLRYFEKYAGLLLALMLMTFPLEITIRRRAFLGFALAVVVTFVVSFGFRVGWVPGSWFPGRAPENPAMFKAHITHGFFMAIGAYVMWVNAWTESDKRWRLAFGIASALAALNSLIVQGRTGYVVLASLVAYLFIQRFRWRGLAIFLFVVTAVGLVLTQFPKSALTSRVTLAVEEISAWEDGRPNSSSMGLRIQFAVTSLRILAEHPLTGVGTGGFEQAYRAASAEGVQVTVNPHNQYLLTAVQLGIPGLALLLLLFAILWHKTGGLASQDQLMARGILIAYIVGSLFNSFLYDHSEARFFAWAIGLLFCDATLRKKSCDTHIPVPAQSK